MLIETLIRPWYSLFHKDKGRSVSSKFLHQRHILSSFGTLQVLKTDPAQTAWHSSCMRASLCTKHSSSPAFKTSRDSLFPLSLHHFHISDLPFLHIALFPLPLFLRFLRRPSPQLPSPPHLPPSPNTDLRLSWTVSQVKFAPASFRQSSFRSFNRCFSISTVFSSVRTSPLKYKPFGIVVASAGSAWSWIWTLLSGPSSSSTYPPLFSSLQHLHCLVLLPPSPPSLCGWSSAGWDTAVRRLPG